MKKQTFLFILFNICFSAAISQNWTHYDSTNGLYANNAGMVTSDKFNNIWVVIGGGNGLDKFDGTTWTHYDTTNSGIPENDVRVAKADTNGNLWIAFHGGAGPDLSGLTMFDGTNWTIYDTTNSAIISNYILDIVIDKQNNVWLSCMGGISKFDGTTFTNYLHPFWGYLLVQDSANIWRAADGLDHFNPITGVWTNYKQSNSNIPSNYPSCIGQDSSGLIWLGFWYGFNGGFGSGGSNGGLATFDGTSFTPIWPFTSSGTWVSGLAIDAAQNIWVANQCEGLFKYDGNTWTQIQGVPFNGCSGSVIADATNHIWYTEDFTGVWTNRTTTGINEQPTDNWLNAFPNPADDFFTIQYKFQHNEMVTLMNSAGAEIMRINIQYKTSQLKVDTRQLVDGMYYWKLTNNSQLVHTGKIAIIK